MDTLYSIVSLIGLTALGIAVAEMLCRFAPKHASADMPDSYTGSLHGLRGFLALLVVVHACWAWFGYGSMSLWAAPSMLIENTGRTAAMLFFALSGFLYWERLRGGAFDLRGFYRNRMRRLLPAYGALLVALFVVAFIRADFRFQENDVLAHLMPWLTLGLSGDFGTLNGVDLKLMHGSALFALTAQCYFYLSLPFLAYFTRGHRVLMLFVAAAALMMLPNAVFGTNVAQLVRDVARLYWPTAGFAMGILASYLLRLPKANKLFKHAAAMPVAFACFLAALYIGHTPWLGQPAPIAAALALVFFMVVASGESFRGTLTHRSLRFLGNISYGMFLFHGIVLYTVMQLLPASMKLDAQSWGRAFVIFAVANAMVMFVAMLSRRFLETRFANRKGRDTYSNVVSMRKAA